MTERVVTHKAPPCALTIFGATGDLARRKLVPALYALHVEELLPPRFDILCVGRSPGTDEGFRSMMEDATEAHARVGFDSASWSAFAQRLHYIEADAEFASGLTPLVDTLAKLDEVRGDTNHCFYLSIPPSAVVNTATALATAGLAGQGPSSFTRLILEKPFGRDLESALALNATLHRYFDEEQLYRIDHYLGKETVQNLMVFRFANGIFEPLWNRQHIDHVQITVAESLGIEGRGAYYEESGALRDMIQSHVMQLLSLVAMEAPSSFSDEMIRDEKVKLLRSIRPIAPDQVLSSTVRGQYGAGVIDGMPVVGYRDEHDVPPQSLRDTYVATRFDIDNWRWAGTPFYVRSGKRLPRRLSEIVIQFRQVPHSPFTGRAETATGGVAAGGIEPNRLIIQVQPEEGITLTFSAKVPGQAMALSTVAMDFSYAESFAKDSPEAYERLILDALNGDATLFAREDEVAESWRLCSAILEGWRRHPPTERTAANYAAGSAGPRDADELLARDGRSWHAI